MVQKKLTKIWDVDVNNIIILELVETKTNSKYLIGYLDKVIRLSVLVLPKMSGGLKLKMEIKIKIIN